MIEIGLEIHIEAPRDRIWEILVNHEGMPRWFPAREVIRWRAGSPDPDGVGARRLVRINGLAVEEAVTSIKPYERLEYAVLAGAPFTDHNAEVVLSREAEGTRVRWSVRLRPLVPGTGWLVKTSVTRTLERALSGLKCVAEKH